LEEALDLSFDRLLTMMTLKIQKAGSCKTSENLQVYHGTWRRTRKSCRPVFDGHSADKHEVPMKEYV
jgi:hypothetical protein